MNQNQETKAADGDPAVQLDVSPTDITWVAGGVTTAQSVTLTVTYPPSGAVTMQVLGALMSVNDAAAILLLDACEPSTRDGSNSTTVNPQGVRLSKDASRRFPQGSAIQVSDL